MCFRLAGSLFVRPFVLLFQTHCSPGWEHQKRTSRCRLRGQSGGSQVRQTYRKTHYVGRKMVVNSSPPSFSFMNPPDSSLLLHPPPFINQLLSSLVHFSFCLHLGLCFRLLFCLFQGLLGSEEPFSSRSWSSLQLLRAFIPKDPPVLPEELWQRGLTSPEWPLLIFISREPQVMNALHRPSIDNFSPACLL